MKKMKILIFILCLYTSGVAQPYSSADTFVGYYGRPYVKSLGILGQSDIDNVVKQLRTISQEYQAVDVDNTVVPTFHIIHDLATLDAGRDKDHIKPMKEKTLLKYIKRAQEENFAVIIDLQLGTMTPLEAVQPILKYLKYDNVHIALDPEFKIPKHRRYPPGKFIGHIFGQDINQVQEAMQNYMSENNIEGKRMLLVHMFYKRMIRKVHSIKKYENIDLTINIDGHGQASTKIKVYNHLYRVEYEPFARSGFKVFYKNDKKPLMTPPEVLGMKWVKDRKLRTKPKYINYQ